MKTLNIFYLIFLLFGFSAIIIDPLIPYISEELDVGYDKIGIALLVGSVFSVVSALISGMLCDKVQIRKVILFGLLVLFLGALIFGIYINFILFFLVLILLRSGFSTIDSSVHIYVTKIFKKKHSPIFLKLDIFWYLGAVIGPLLIGIALFFNINPNFAFYLLALAFFVVLILFFFVTKNAGKIQKSTSNINFKPVLKVVKNPVVITASFLLFFGMGTMVGLSTWLTTYFTAFNIEISISSIVLSGFWLFSSMGLYLGKKILPRTNEITLLLIGSIAGALFLAAVSFLDMAILKIIFLLLHALFFSIIFTLGISITAYEGSNLKGTIIGFNIAIAISGGLLFRPLLGFVAEYVGKSYIIFLNLLGSLITVICVIILYIVLKHKYNTKLKFFSK